MMVTSSCWSYALLSTYRQCWIAELMSESFIIALQLDGLHGQLSSCLAKTVSWTLPVVYSVRGHMLSGK